MMEGQMSLQLNNTSNLVLRYDKYFSFFFFLRCLTLLPKSLKKEAQVIQAIKMDHLKMY